MCGLFKFPWAEMLTNETGEVHHVKWMVCSFVKGKDVILGPKVNTFEKHAGKTRVV
jgi:hypothetical protein